jgi:hypothetical protein
MCYEYGFTLSEWMDEETKLSFFLTLHFHGVHGKGALVWFCYSGLYSSIETALYVAHIRSYNRVT